MNKIQFKSSLLSYWKKIENFWKEIENFWKKRTHKVVGIDIIDSSIRIVAVEIGANDIIITSHGIVTLSHGVVVKDRIEQQELVTHALLTFKEQMGLEGYIANIALSISYVLIKILSVQASFSEEEILNYLEVELEQFIPVEDLDSIYFDFEVLGPSSSNLNHVEILLAIAKKDMVQSHVNAIEMAGIPVKAVEVRTFAFGRVFKTCLPFLKNSSLFGYLEIKTGGIHFYVFKNGTLIYNREIFLNEKEDGSKVNYLKLKSNQYTKCGSLVEHVKQLIQCFLLATEYTDISFILINSKILKKVLQRECGVKFLLIDPFQGVSLSVFLNKKDFRKNSASLWCAYGLALRGK